MVAVFLLVAEVGFGIEGSPVGTMVKLKGAVEANSAVNAVTFCEASLQILV